mmetsp:Transcript_27156/g.77970  ORF Transcript_27156/g.77970 Transcript_27156/m.77970 type:complete len:373 (+) Transcript_27156:369-1487(+)
MDQVVEAAEAWPRDALDLNHLSLACQIRGLLPLFFHGISEHDANHKIGLPGVDLQIPPAVDLLGERAWLDDITLQVAPGSASVLVFCIGQPPAPVHGQVEPDLRVSHVLVSGHPFRVFPEQVLTMVVLLPPDLDVIGARQCVSPLVRCSPGTGHYPNVQCPALLPDLCVFDVPTTGLLRMSAGLDRSAVQEPTRIHCFFVSGVSDPPPLVACHEEPEVWTLLVLVSRRCAWLAVPGNEVVEAVHKAVGHTSDLKDRSLKSCDPDLLPCHVHTLRHPEARRLLRLPLARLRCLPGIHARRQCARRRRGTAHPALWLPVVFAFGVADPPTPRRRHEEPLLGSGLVLKYWWTLLCRWDVNVCAIQGLVPAAPKLK